MAMHIGREILRVILLPAIMLIVPFQGCTTILCLSGRESVKEIRRSCATDEPGSYLNPRCNLVARMASDYDFNPDSAFSSRKNLVKFISKNISRIDNCNIPVAEGEIRIRIYNDAGRFIKRMLPVVVYYHGGGFQHGSIETFDYYSRKLASSLEAVVVVIEYRLAPDFVFPTAVNDAYSGLLWTYEHITDYGGDRENIFVMGGSAGGNLAAVMPLVCHERGGPELAGQILCYPATTFTDTLFSSRIIFSDNDGKFILTRDFLLKCKELYLGSDKDERHPWASPLLADLPVGMPPALVITAQCDPLRDEGRAYADKLSESGTGVTYIEYKGMIHAFMPLYPVIKEGRRAIKEVALFIEAN